ncbi:MAG: hypothetical protein AB1467_03285 [Candidatus Diapherotrites archaeon]
MRVSVLGTGDITKIPRHTKIKERELRELIKGTAELIARKGHELVIVPDKGIPSEVARIYKEKGGRKVYGLVPVKDKKFGVKHLKPFLYLVDERIELDHWYDVDGEIAAAGKLCIVFGLSPGVIREIAVLKYHYKYLKCKTKVLWFKNTLSRKIPEEIEEEIPITYIPSVKELEKFL